MYTKNRSDKHGKGFEIELTLQPQSKGGWLVGNYSLNPTRVFTCFKIKTKKQKTKPQETPQYSLQHLNKIKCLITKYVKIYNPKLLNPQTTRKISTHTGKDNQ